ncbi:MAG: TlyA family RNA methyltransferase [Actinomycetota bacterium]
MARRRLDAELVRRKLVDSRRAAQEQIAAGLVVVDGAPADKPARLVDPGQDVRVLGPPPPFVSRAGGKLAHALDEFGLDPSGWICVDVGSSTGGFTDCLLQRGARLVTAIDVGTHQLHEKLRGDDRVVVREQTDVRSIDVATVAGPVGLVVTDVSFISLSAVLPALAALADGAPVIALVKPQFEVGKADASKGRGVIRDPQLWREVLTAVIGTAADLGLGLHGLSRSPVTGTKGNVEFVAHLRQGPSSLEPIEVIDAVAAGAHDAEREHP